MICGVLGECEARRIAVPDSCARIGFDDAITGRSGCRGINAQDAAKAWSFGVRCGERSSSIVYGKNHARQILIAISAGQKKKRPSRVQAIACGRD